MSVPTPLDNPKPGRTCTWNASPTNNSTPPISVVSSIAIGVGLAYFIPALISGSFVSLITASACLIGGGAHFALKALSRQKNQRSTTRMP